MSSSYQGPENRIDPDNKMGLDFHAARALSRKNTDGNPEFANLSPEARREAIANPKTKFRKPEMRTKLLQYLNRLESVRTQEQLELIATIEAQYDAASSDWKNKENIDMAGFPTKERVTQWANNLSSETLNGMLELNMNQFQLVPKGRTVDLLKVVPGVISWENGWKNVKVDNWTFGVTNGQEDMPFDQTLFYKDAEQKEERTNKEMPIEAKRS